MDPAGRRYLEVCCSDTGCYRNQGCHREPVGKEENPSPKNAKRCDTGDQKRHHINPAAQFMDRRTFWPHHNQSTDSKCDHASDKMHPPERQKIEVHNLRPGSHPCVPRNTIFGHCDILPEPRRADASCTAVGQKSTHAVEATDPCLSALPSTTCLVMSASCQ